MDKTEIRNQFIELRSDLSTDARATLDAQILDQIIATVDFSNAFSVHCYKSVESWCEIDTTKLIAHLQSKWPDIELVIGEPNRSTLLPAKPFDIIFIPILAYDEHRNRLGFGGGWYDRFLEGQPNALKIGLAYDIQQAEELPTEPHDIPMDMIITESRILTK